MSQAGSLSTGGSGPIPPTVATSYVTDVNSPAVPAANILNVPGGSTTTNNDHGIQTDGSSGSNTLTIQLSNRQTGTVTTADATLTTIISFPLGATPSTFYVYGNVQAFNSTNPAGGGYSYSGAYRTDGATATELGTEFHDEFEDPVLTGSDIFLNTSGNNVLLQVQGVAATSINWNALIEFRKVS
jgi:hypothetical protein